MSQSLLERTLHLVRNRPPSLTLEQLANEAGVNHNWLKAFILERYPNPRIREVEKLHAFLSSKR